MIRVIDGATIEVESGGRIYRVRYMGIRAPEDATLDGGETSARQKALEFNRYLVAQRTVQLEKGDVETDMNGDLLRYVYVGGEMVNMALLTNGHATVADFPTAFRYETEFLMAEENAKNNLRGIWASLQEGGQPDVSAQVATTSAPQFGAGTLPAPPSGGDIGGCDFSGSLEPVIKGVVNALTGRRIYHVPGGLSYAATPVDEANGDRWFCTEVEAMAAGWNRSLQ